MYTKILKVLWDMKYIIIFGLVFGILLAATSYYKEMYEHEKSLHEKTIITKEKEYVTMENSYIIAIAKFQQQAIENQLQHIEQYNRSEQRIDNLIKQQEQVNESISSMSSDINNDVGRLQQQIKNISNSNSNSNGTKDNDSKTTNSVQKLSTISTECISEYSKMGEYAERERLAKETLQNSWEVVRSEYVGEVVSK